MLQLGQTLCTGPGLISISPQQRSNSSTVTAYMYVCNTATSRMAIKTVCHKTILFVATADELTVNTLELKKPIEVRHCDSRGDRSIIVLLKTEMCEKVQM